MKTLHTFEHDGRHYMLVEAAGTNPGKRFRKHVFLRAVTMPARFEFKNCRQPGVVVLDQAEADSRDQGHESPHATGKDKLLALLGWHATPKAVRNLLFIDFGFMTTAVMTNAREALGAALDVHATTRVSPVLAGRVRERAVSRLQERDLNRAERAVAGFLALLDELPASHPWRAADDLARCLLAVFDLADKENRAWLDAAFAVLDCQPVLEPGETGLIDRYEDVSELIH